MCLRRRAPTRPLSRDAWLWLLLYKVREWETLSEGQFGGDAHVLCYLLEPKLAGFASAYDGCSAAQEARPWRRVNDSPNTILLLKLPGQERS